MKNCHLTFNIHKKPSFCSRTTCFWGFNLPHQKKSEMNSHLWITFKKNEKCSHLWVLFSTTSEKKQFTRLWGAGASDNPFLQSPLAPRVQKGSSCAGNRCDSQQCCPRENILFQRTLLTPNGAAVCFKNAHLPSRQGISIPTLHGEELKKSLKVLNHSCEKLGNALMIVWTNSSSQSFI